MEFKNDEIKQNEESREEIGSTEDIKDEQHWKEVEERLASVGKGIDHPGKPVMTRKDYEKTEDYKRELETKKSFLEKIKESFTNNKKKR